MNEQLSRLMTSLYADDIEETSDRVYFKTGNKHHEVHKRFPLILLLETSSYCNLVCVGCPQKDLTRKKGFMNPDLFRKVIDEVAEYDTRTWFHFMGEPLMHPHIFEMIEYAADKGLPYFGMSTNGLLLTEDKIDRLLDSGLQRFEISLDALDPELFALVRPGGSPERIMENAREFFRRKYQRNQRHPITSVSTRAMSETAHQINDFAEYWNDILRDPDFILAIGWNSFGGYSSLDHATYRIEGERVPCLKLWTMAIVLSEGQVVTCDPMYDAQVVMGDANQSSIYDIWNGAAYQERRQAHLDGRYQELEVCAGCTDWWREISTEMHRNLSSDQDLTWAEIHELVEGRGTG